MANKYNDPEWIGKKFNKLTVIEPVHVITCGGKSKQWYWRVKCDCGNEKVMCPNEIITGHSVSCGCYHKSGTIKPTLRHGESHTKLHNVWCGMNNRCDPKHKSSDRYGKRGIKVCEEWKVYENFAKWARENGYREDYTIERIDVDGNYEPNNCTWIPLAQQAMNRSTTHWVMYDGEKMSMAEACERANMPYKQVFWRMKHLGWPFEKAVSVPMGEAREKFDFECTCAVCGKDFISRSPKAIYCSHECYLVKRMYVRKGLILPVNTIKNANNTT